MKKKTKDYLKFTDIKIYQDDEMFCVNTDTALLGRFLDFRKGASVLDIGTNNGALLLYASLRKPSRLCGIDIFGEALDLAFENLLMNGIKAELHLGKIQEFKTDPFDVIITNPPFFEMNNPRLNTYMEKAMFEESLPLDELCEAFRRLLKDNGVIYMIYPADRAVSLLCALKDKGFKVMKMQYVYDLKKEYALRVLLKIKKGPLTKTRVLRPVLIDDGKISEL